MSGADPRVLVVLKDFAPESCGPPPTSLYFFFFAQCFSALDVLFVNYPANFGV